MPTRTTKPARDPEPPGREPTPSRAAPRRPDAGSAAVTAPKPSKQSVQAERLALRRQAADIFTVGTPVFRFMQKHRGRICPFDRLIAGVPPGSSILDVGCGGGLFLHLLHANGRIREGVGFDTSQRAIELAHRTTKANKTWLRFVHVERDAPFWPRSEEHLRPADPAQGKFDAVSMIDVLHHVPAHDQEAFFQKAIGCVRPGGVLLYKDMVSRPRWRAAANRLHDLLLARQWIHYVPMPTVEKWASKAGLVPVSSENINMLWYGHELRVWRKP